MDVLNAIMDYVMHYTVVIATACTLFALMFKKRSFFYLRYLLSFAFFYACSLLYSRFVPDVKIGNSSFSGTFILNFFFTAAILLVSFDLSWKELIVCLTAGSLVQHLVSSLGFIANLTIRLAFPTFNIFGHFPVFVLTVFLYPLAYVVLAKRLKNPDVITHIESTTILFFMGVATLIVYFLSYAINSQLLALDNVLLQDLVFFYDSLSCAFLLALQFGVFTQRKLADDNQLLQGLLAQQEKQQRLSKNSIEMINIKCHDLKNQVDAIRKTSGAEHREELLDNLEKDVMIYDSIAKTGNEALDIVLTEKSLDCEHFDVKFTYIVDIQKMGFLEAGDVYSLFGNALDNALESVKQEKKDARIITLNISGKDAFLNIVIENYCSREISFKDGLPVTSKKDAANHGYGLKSIRYIVEKYHGALNVSFANNTFRLFIVIPMASLKAPSLIA